MQKVSVKDILHKAHEMTKAKKDWHFHIFKADLKQIESLFYQQNK